MMKSFFAITVLLPHALSLALEGNADSWKPTMRQKKSSLSHAAINVNDNGLAQKELVPENDDSDPDSVHSMIEDARQKAGITRSCTGTALKAIQQN